MFSLTSSDVQEITMSPVVQRFNKCNIGLNIDVVELDSKVTIK